MTSILFTMTSVAFFVLGLGMMGLGISTNSAFLGAGVVFIIIGMVGMKRARGASGKTD